MNKQKIMVQKFDLIEGEDIYSFLEKVRCAVKEKFDPATGVYPTAVYADSVVVNNYTNDKYYQMPMTRDSEGMIELGDATEVIKVVQFVPAKGSTNKSDAVVKAVNLPPVHILLENEEITKGSLAVLKSVANNQPSLEMQEIVVKAAEPAKETSFWQGIF